MSYHDKTIKETLDLTATHEEGLTNAEAEKRLLDFGPNKLKESKKEGLIKIFLRQFNDVLIYILILASVVSFFAGEKIDAYVIFAILIFNAVFGFIQEYKAEKAIELLRKLTTLTTKVIRDGKIIQVPSSEIVKGDVIVLESGDKVSADLRIIEERNLQTDEAALTGESNPISKIIKAISSKTPLAERKNMLYSSTNVVRGNAKAVVVATGMETEIGKIAKMVQEAEHNSTPLQKKLKEFSKFLGYITIIICALVFVIGVIRGLDLFEMFMTAIALAVAVVPEGLPAVVTVSLAIGVQRMVKRNALIRRLSSIETLGCITVICSDKTGTLTKNEMTVTKTYANHKSYTITGRGYNDLGEFLDSSNNQVNPEKEFPLMLECAISCNDSTESIGDPTERALLFAAKKGKASKRDRKDEIPFDSDAKFMATMHDGLDYYKGAPEIILKMCNSIIIDGKKRRMLPKDKEKILEANKEMAANALRILAMAQKINNEMYFLGLMGMIDPPKENVSEALKKCETAGIRPVMITGDHPLTAAAIAMKIGMKGKVISGPELDEINDGQLKETVINYSIYARVTSEQKVRILKALQRNNEIVAMTGDGLNDAPAIKNSDVGVAMSIKGTDITRDASDVVLTDDNFASIVNAIEEGRIIYDNIKKFIRYLLSANMAEIGVILVAMLAGLPLPLLPLQILWINLMTDSWPALALGVDPPDHDVMNRNPRSSKENIISHIKFFIFAVGIIGTISVLSIFLWSINAGHALEKSRTFALTTLIVIEMFVVYSSKSDRPFTNMLNNGWLNIAVIFSLLLQILIIYTPLNILFKLAPLSSLEWLPVIGLGLISFLILEFLKSIRHKYLK
jgi:P-type Ca2+ transporter type 2C